MMLRRLFRRAVCAALALVLSGCGEVEKIIEVEQSPVFRHYYSSECSTLNYLITNMYADTAVSANVIDCLVDYDSFGNMIPGLAESWQSNEDMTEWTFKIRSGVKWVDWTGGEVAEVKADDWVAAAEYVNNAENRSTCQYVYSSGAVIHGADEYYAYTKYMKESSGGTYPNDADGHPFIIPPEARAEDIGVHAPDDHTLVFTLDSPCPFFLSLLTFTPFMPVNRQFLEAEKDKFGSDNKHLLYNGAYILSAWSPYEQRTMTKNESYWDAGKVYLERIEELYNPDAFKVQADMYLKGEVDMAQLNPEELEEWMSDRKLRKLVHPALPDNSYSYFYCFNFDPQFSDRYDCDNWRLAVNNENFRKAVAAAIDRRALVAVYDPYSPDRLVANTITPKEFVSAGGVDYTEQKQFAELSADGSPDVIAARRYASAARGELGQIGAKFPVKMLVPYKAGVVGWETESKLLESQLERVLGTDFIDVIVEEGSDTDFIGNTRENGNYAFLKCNWGADYNDPDTFTEPFNAESLYNFWNKAGSDAAKLYSEWCSITREARSITGNDAARYSRFADAERLLIDHAIAVPISIECSDGYIVSKLDQFEGEYSVCGIARQRFKLMHLYESSYSTEDSERRYTKWKKERSSQTDS